MIPLPLVITPLYLVTITEDCEPYENHRGTPQCTEQPQLWKEQWTCKATSRQTGRTAPWLHTPPCECSLSQARRVRLLQPPAPTQLSTQMQNMSMNMNAAHQHHYKRPSPISQHPTIEFTLAILHSGVNWHPHCCCQPYRLYFYIKTGVWPTIHDQCIWDKPHQPKKQWK